MGSLLTPLLMCSVTYLIQSHCLKKKGREEDTHHIMQQILPLCHLQTMMAITMERVKTKATEMHRNTPSSISEVEDIPVVVAGSCALIP